MLRDTLTGGGQTDPILFSQSGQSPAYASYFLLDEWPGNLAYLARIPGRRSVWDYYSDSTCLRLDIGSNDSLFQPIGWMPAYVR